MGLPSAVTEADLTSLIAVYIVGLRKITAAEEPSGSARWWHLSSTRYLLVRGDPEPHVFCVDDKSTALCKSQNHSMVGLGRDLCGSPSPTPCRSRVTHSRLHRTASRRVLNISREGDSTASLGSLGQGSVTLRGKKFFL